MDARLFLSIYTGTRWSLSDKSIRAPITINRSLITNWQEPVAPISPDINTQSILLCSLLINTVQLDIFQLYLFFINLKSLIGDNQ